MARKKKRLTIKGKKGLVILTHTPYSKLSKEDANRKHTLFIDVTGLEKVGGHNVLVFGKNRDPTSILLLLEQILEEIDIDYVNIEEVDSFLLELSENEVKRFLDHLRSFLALKDISLYVGGEEV